MKIGEYIVQLIIILNLKIMGIFNPRHAQRAKRMLFLTSLTVALAREGIIKRNTLDSLNADLSLARNSSTLLIGEELSKGIWQGVSLKNTFNNTHTGYLNVSEIDRISENVINKTPSWINYGHDFMKEDISSLLVTKNIQIAS